MRTKVGRITGISWHFGKTPRDLTQSLSPSRCTISHHRHVVAHVTEELGSCNTSVNRSFSSCYRHIGRVSHKRGSLHDGFFFTINSCGELRKIAKHFSHFIASLAATNIHNNIRVRILGQCLRNNSLATTKCTWHCSSTTLRNWKKRINDTLACQECYLALQLLHDRTRISHRP